MATLAPFFKQQFFDQNGDPLVGGKVYTYAAGTSTPLETYNSASGLVANPNPVILDANGEADIWLGTALYKIVIATANDVVVKTVDNVSYASAGAVGTDQLAAGAVTTAKLADLSVTTVKLADDAVTTDKIDEDAVRTANILDEAVTTSKIASLSVTTAKLAAASVTQEKRAALSYQISASSGTVNKTTTAEADVTNLSVTITTTGRPVFVGMISDATIGALYSGEIVGATGNVNLTTTTRLYRDSTVIASHSRTIRANSSYTQVEVSAPPSSFFHVDTPSAGTYTYKITSQQSSVASGTGTSRYIDCKLIAYEL